MLYCGVRIASRFSLLNCSVWLRFERAQIIRSGLHFVTQYDDLLSRESDFLASVICEIDRSSVNSCIIGGLKSKLLSDDKFRAIRDILLLRAAFLYIV